MTDEAAQRPVDRVNRQFTATRPNQLWVADFTYVATWAGLVYVAFVIDVFARRIVGWHVASSMRTGSGAGCAGAGAVVAHWDGRCLVHHSDRGSQYLSIRYTRAPGGSRQLSHRLAASVIPMTTPWPRPIIGLYKTEVIRHRGPWRHIDAVEYATLEWVDWFNHRRLLEPSVTCHQRSWNRRFYYRQLEESAMAA